MPQFSKPYCPDNYGYEADGTGAMDGNKLCKLSSVKKASMSLLGREVDDPTFDYIIINKDGKQIGSGSDKSKMKVYTKKDDFFEFKGKSRSKRSKHSKQKKTRRSKRMKQRRSKK
jgi:hypothetical protein